MRIKSMKKVKAISVLLIAFTALLTCKEANAQRGSSYVLPPSAPSNWIVNPANPIYSPRGSRTNPSNNGSYRSNSSSSIESLRSQQIECARRVKNRYGYSLSTPMSYIRNDSKYSEIVFELQNECVTPFLFK
jgi:hypothetical protein